MARFYSSDDWYWLVSNGPGGQVYHSARHAYVALADAQYVAFLADGNLPTVIDTEDNLRSVLNTAEVGFAAEPLPLVEVKRPALVRERARLSIASFSLPSATPTAVPWDTEGDDPLNIHTAGQPDRIVIPVAGVYQAVAEVGFAANTVGLRAAQLRVGPTTPVGTSRHAPPPEDDSEFQVVSIFPVAAAGAILRLFMEQRSGGAILCRARITLGRVG